MKKCEPSPPHCTEALELIKTWKIWDFGIIERAFPPPESERNKTNIIHTWTERIKSLFLPELKELNH